MFYVSTHQRSCNFCLESSIQRLKESLVTWSNNNHLKLDNNKIWSCGGLGCFNMDNSTQDIKKSAVCGKFINSDKKGVLDLELLTNKIESCQSESKSTCVQNWKIWDAHTTNKKHNGSCWCKSITSLFLTFEMAVDNAISHLIQFQQVFCRCWSYHVIIFKRCICMESFKRIHSACDTIKR